MIDVMSPAFLFLIGAIILPLLPQGNLRSAILLGAPLAAGLYIINLSPGVAGGIEFGELTLQLLRVDKLSVIFGLVFCIAAFLANLYALHVRDTIQQVAALGYAGSAIGAVFAGDLVSLFIFWEGTAITSVFLVWARRTEGAYHTGMRYLMVQITAGVMLLGGIVLLYRETGSLAFEAMTLGSLSTWLIFVAFGIKCAFPFLHNWLPDAYPAATVTGSVLLSSFTTKLAVYALARGFPGTEILIYIGVTMALFAVPYAFVENNVRRVLAYALISQLGFMVAGIGLGSELSINGAVAHAVAGIFYTSLMFMAVGAVLYRTGSDKLSQLGGLFRTMPATFLFCLVGAASISAVPLFAGFASKSLILSDAVSQGHYYAWGLLYGASVAAFLHTGIRIPYLVFFSNDSGLRPEEAPSHMKYAMGFTVLLCLGVGIVPGVLYGLLPFPVDYDLFTTTHVITQLQLLFFAALAFLMLKRFGLVIPVRRSVHLDTDWIYRKLLPGITGVIGSAVAKFWSAKKRFWLRRLDGIVTGLYKSHGPEGRMARVWPTGSMVLWIAIILSAILTINFV